MRAEWRQILYNASHWWKGLWADLISHLHTPKVYRVWYLFLGFENLKTAVQVIGGAQRGRLRKYRLKDSEVEPPGFGK